MLPSWQLHYPNKSLQAFFLPEIDVVSQNCKTQNVEIVRRLLCHSNSSATVNYLGIEDSDALEVARTINV